MPKRGENIYKRKDGRWEGRIMVQTPQKRLLSVYGKSYREVKDKMNEAKLHSNTKECKDSISDAVSLWLASKKQILKPSSLAKYRNLADRHILPILGKKRICELDEPTVLDFAVKLSLGQTSGGITLSRGTVSNVLMILEKSVKLSGGQDFMIDKKKLIVKPSGKRRVTVLTDDEQRRLEQYLLTDTDEKKLGLLLCLYAGLRIGEVCALRWNRIRLPEKTLSVTTTMQRLQTEEVTAGRRTEVTESTPKSEDSCRVVPIADFIVDRLRKLKPHSESAYLLTGNERYIEPRSYENFYKRVLVATNIPANNFHTLRHTFATRCIENGIDVKTVSELLGHSTVKLTLDRYVHPTMDAKQNSVNRLAISRQQIWSNV